MFSFFVSIDEKLIFRHIIIKHPVDRFYSIVVNTYSKGEMGTIQFNVWCLVRLFGRINSLIIDIIKYMKKLYFLLD